MPESREAFLARRKEELFQSLRRVHDGLTDVQDQHNGTEYGCQRAGNCCTVGLQLHMMECEYIARNLLAMTGGDEDLLEPFIQRLEYAFEDHEWTWAESVGSHKCAFFEDGCTIYPVRPGVCRMYGVVLEVDEWCPRRRLANGNPFVYRQKETDRLAAEFYKALDLYGRLWPKKDYTVYMPRGVLEFLVPQERLKKLKERTAKRFWRREKGYRTQYEQSYRVGESRRTNVEFNFEIPGVKK